MGKSNCFLSALRRLPPCACLYEGKDWEGIKSKYDKIRVIFVERYPKADDEGNAVIIERKTFTNVSPAIFYIYLSQRRVSNLFVHTSTKLIQFIFIQPSNGVQSLSKNDTQRIGLLRSHVNRTPIWYEK